MFNIKDEKKEKEPKKEPLKKPNEDSEDNVETVIGPSVKVEGDFNGNGDVVVEGMVVGNLKTTRDLRISEGAVVEADVQARNIVIAGKVVGNIKVQETSQLTSTAHITGDIQTNVLSIDSGAVVNGRCISGNKEERAAAKEEAPIKRTVTRKVKAEN